MTRVLAPILLLLGVVLGGATLALVRGRATTSGGRPYAVLEDAHGVVLEAPDGTALRLRSPRRRIVALALSAEEIIVELAGASALAGVSRFARQPELSNIATEVDAVETTVVGANPEQIVRLAPDVVLVTSYTDPRARAALEVCGLDVFPLPDPTEIATVRTTIDLLGRILGREREAAALIREIDGRLRTIADAIPPGPRPRVLYLSDASDLWAAGANTVIGEVIELAGCENVAATGGLTGFRKVGRERVVWWNPDWLLLEGTGAGDARAPEAFIEDPLLSRTAAVRERRIIVVPARKLTSVSHHVVDAVDMLFRGVHGVPEPAPGGR